MTVAATLDVIVGASTSQLQSGLRDADRSVSGFASGAENRIGRFATTVGATMGAAFIGVSAFAVNAASEWESAFADVEKTVDASDEQLAALEDTLRGMATSEVLGSLDDAHTTLAGIAAAAGALGVETDAIDEFTASVAALDVASDLTAESAADFIARFANITGLNIAEDVDNVADTIVTLGNSMAATEGEIATFANRLASLSTFGYDPAEILGLSSAMASLGLSAELGGTNLLKTVSDITTAAATGGESLQILANATGMTAEEFANLANTDASGALLAFLEALQGMDASEQIQTLNELGMTSAEQQRVLMTMAAGLDTVNQGLETANEAWQGNGAAMAEAEAKADTLQGSMNRLQNSMNEAGVSLGERFVPGLADLATGLAEIINGNYADGLESISEGLMDIGSGIGQMVTGDEMFDFQSTIDSWTFAWNALRSISQDILQDAKLFFLNLQYEVALGALNLMEAANVNGMFDTQIADVRMSIGLIVEEEKVIAAARQIEDDVAAAMASGEPLNLSDFLTFESAGETFMIPMEEVLLNPEIIAEVDPFTLQNLQTQISQQIQEAAASGDANELAIAMQVAANLGIDGNAVINQMMVDMQAQIDALIASGDIGAIEALMPTLIHLGFDAAAISAEAKEQLKAGLESDSIDATVTANITIAAGEVINNAAAAVLATLGSSGATAASGATGGATPPRFHGGGVYHAPHGESEGWALLSDGETIRTPNQENSLGGGGGSGANKIYNVNLYGSSPYEVYEMTQRAARDSGYE